MRRAASVIVVVLACGGPGTRGGTGGESGRQGTPAGAEQLMAQVDAELRRVWVAQSEAEWAHATNITPQTEAAAAAAGAEAMSYVTKAIKQTRQFDAIADRLDADTRRQILLLRVSGQAAPDDPKLAAELAELMTRMDAAFSTAKVCDRRGKCRDLQQLEEIFTKSRRPAALAAAWTGWHDTAGAAVAPFYPRFVELANAGAAAIGFADVGDLWRAGYDMPAAEFEREVDRLWSQVEPLYRDLHCHVRRRLGARYGVRVVDRTGPLPAHLLGNMWAQTWVNLYRDLEPHKNVVQLDVTPALRRQRYDAVRMARLGEAFFTSLGLDPLPATFWERSLLTKPRGREVVCHASAWDVGFNDDLRIKMCTRINHEDLATLHHELGHDYYFHYYHKLPILYQNGPNDGFHEAIGDTIALSMTPAYLAKVGLLGKVVSNDKATINQQMHVALDKIAFLPFGLVVDKWRWEVFAGKVKPADYNRRWWELRRRYQGIVPPVSRDDAVFDPGAKYHIPANTPYTRYFLATVLQFQFHRALCRIAGHTGPLHACSIYGSKPAGDALRRMLALGASRPWPDALEALTGERRMDASALIEYFAPLGEWLQKQNAGQTCGW